MNIEELGYNSVWAKSIADNKLEEFTVARIIRENRERYIASTGSADYEAEITGNMRYSASSRADFPAVGDWVVLNVYDNESAIIHSILPRISLLERQETGKNGEKQIIAANVDCAFIVQSADNNLNINRLERYLSICYDAGIDPVMVISKIDLATGDELAEAVGNITKREKQLKYVLISNETEGGLEGIIGLIERGKTYCVLGSSGVGKSTLINNLLKKDVLRTSEISTSTGKGKHTTGFRELFVLDNGGIIIDTPGMKELGMTDNIEGIRTTFREIFELALNCRLPGCRHIDEKGCAVLDAISSGKVDRASVENFRKMQREQEHFSATVAEKRRRDREFGKMCRNIMNEKKKSKF